jgi:SAM-dependent methyltransferase
MRLENRKIHVWNASYLVYIHLWPNIEKAVGRAKKTLGEQSRRVLDIGCGRKPYADLFADCEYIGLNHSIDDATPDVIGTATMLPFADESLDLIFCTQVLEHVGEPWVLFEECYRTLKAGQILVLSAPFYWPLHEEPNDYYRFTKYGLRQLSDRAGFVEFQLWEDGGDFSRLCISMLHVLPRFLELAMRIPLNLLGRVLDSIAPRFSLPANYTMIARKPEARH